MKSTFKLTSVLFSSILLSFTAHADDSEELDYTRGVVPFEKSPGAVNLGMSNVPVFDQGLENTCGVFATTAAIEARFNSGDFIDQQCIMAVNVGLGKNYWERGINPLEVINTIRQYGIIRKGECFDSDYPDKNQSVSLKKYISSPFNNNGYGQYINYSFKSGIDLSLIKSSLNDGLRVIVIFALSNDASDPGFNLNIRGERKYGGLWACTQSKEKDTTDHCLPQQEFHAVVVTGYDDKQKLFKTRNSWGNQVGDNGDYYISYKFLSTMGNSQIVIK